MKVTAANHAVKNSNAGPEVKWCLAINKQKIHQDGPNGIPEIEIGIGDVIEYFCCAQDAIDACDSYLLSRGAKATWPDINPIEACSCCGADLQTSSWFHAVCVSQEIEHQSSIETLDARDIAYFCPECVPTKKSESESADYPRGAITLHPVDGSHLVELLSKSASRKRIALY